MTEPPAAPTDPRVPVLAVYLERALRASPRECPDRPWMLWELSRLILDQVDDVAGEFDAIDDELEDAFGGLL